MKAAVLIGLLLFVQLGSALLIGAFNIQKFGKEKARKNDVLDNIAKIVRRYDIVLIQEVLGSSLDATNMLMNQVNTGSSEYGREVSDPLGSGSYKERYLFIYRKKSVSVDGRSTYPNTKNEFSRPPFVVMFSSGAWKFVLIPQHTCPEKAVVEMDALHDVVEKTKTDWGNNDILILGDFNAGGKYIKPEDWDNIRLWNMTLYHWLIPDTAVTNVKCERNPCTYDRIVATTQMNAHVVAGSAKVYNFDTDLGLDKTEAEAVSDHYPVEVELN